MVCGGGGGVPVVRSAQAQLRGVEAVVDKDLTAAALRRSLNADALLVLTDVPAVIDGYGTPDARPIRAIAADCGRWPLTFPAGSMGPKVEAASASSRRPAGWRPSAGSRTPRPCWTAGPGR